MENKRTKGTKYEQYAAEYLISCGYRIIECNYRCYAGEIDLIAQDGKYLVFVEVKYRKNTRQGFPQEAVNRAKQRTILTVAQHYRMTHRIGDRTPVRFDVVAILGNTCSLMKHAFEG